MNIGIWLTKDNRFAGTGNTCKLHCHTSEFFYIRKKKTLEKLL